MVLLKEFFEKVDFEKNQQMTKSMENYPVGNRVNVTHLAGDDSHKMPSDIYFY